MPPPAERGRANVAKGVRPRVRRIGALSWRLGGRRRARNQEPAHLHTHDDGDGGDDRTARFDILKRFCEIVF